MSGKELNQDGRCVGGGTQTRIERIEEKEGTLVTIVRLREEGLWDYGQDRRSGENDFVQDRWNERGRAQLMIEGMAEVEKVRKEAIDKRKANIRK